MIDTQVEPIKFIKIKSKKLDIQFELQLYKK